jgi:LysM repeat protein
MVLIICLIVVSCSSRLRNNIVYQASLSGIQDGDIILAGTTRYVYVNAKGMGDLRFTWEDSTGVLSKDGSESAINYLVPNIDGDNYLKVSVKSGENSASVIRIVKFKILLPAVTPTPIPLPSSTNGTPTSLVTVSPSQTITPLPLTTLTPTARPPDNITYIVKTDDTLFGISRNLFGSITYADEIAKSNCIKNNIIYPEQKLSLKIVTVQRGDALSLIAERYSFTTEQLLEINDEISSPSFIYAGQLIFLPIKSCS